MFETADVVERLKREHPSDAANPSHILWSLGPNTGVRCSGPILVRPEEGGCK